MKHEVLETWIEGDWKCTRIRFDNGNVCVFRSEINRVYYGVDACNSNLDSLSYEGMTKQQRLEAHGPRGERPSGTWGA